MKNYGEWADFFADEMRRLLPAEYSVAELMDGMRGVTDIVDEYVDAFASLRAWPSVEGRLLFEIVARLAFAEWHCRCVKEEAFPCESESSVFLVSVMSDSYRGEGRLDWLSDALCIEVGYD